MSEEIKDTEEIKETENISVEDKKVDVPEKKYTDADIDEIVNSKFAKWQEKKEKEINEAKKLADMNAQQKAEFERDKIQKELEELRRANTLNEMSGTARSMLKEENINVEDDFLEVLVSEDADKTKARVDSFSKMFNDAVEKEVLARIKNPNDKRGTTSTLSKKEIMSIKDTATRQKKIKENMHLFN